MEYLHYRTDVIDPDIPFLRGLSALEEQYLTRQCGPLGAEAQWVLKRLTGCQDFAEFKRRAAGPDPQVDVLGSLLLIDRLDLAAETMEITLQLRSLAGIELAELERGFERRSDTVHHRFFLAPADHRRRGLGTRVIQSQEEAWRAAGYQHIRLEASKQDGKVYWALQGYDFDPQTGDQARVAAYLTRRLEEFSVRRDMAGNPYIRAALARLGEGPLPSWEVAQVTVIGADGQEHLLGEEALKYQSWHAYKRLDDRWPGNEQANRKRQQYF